MLHNKQLKGQKVIGKFKKSRKGVSQIETVKPLKEWYDSKSMMPQIFIGNELFSDL